VTFYFESPGASPFSLGSVNGDAGEDLPQENTVEPVSLDEPVTDESGKVSNEPETVVLAAYTNDPTDADGDLGDEFSGDELTEIETASMALFSNMAREPVTITIPVTVTRASANGSRPGRTPAPAGASAVTVTPPATPEPAEEAPEEPEAQSYEPMQPIDPPGTRASAVKSTNTLIIGDEEFVFPAVNIHGYNWLKLRDIAMILTGSGKGFSLRYDAASKTVHITTGGTYAPVGDELEDLPDVINAVASPQRLVVDGVPVDIAAYNINGYNFFRMRDLAILLDFAVNFDANNGNITLDLNKPYSER
jgi:hypothetical protein